MTSSDTFCLKWNEFEKNVSETLRDFKDDSDFYDVTLACEDDQIQAHKIIISACSPFFRQVLKKHKHNNPLLYLKGVRFSDMVSLLTFMYHGEVNVAQDDINQFLKTAEELQVKGLTHKENEKQEEVPKTSIPNNSGGLKIKSEPNLSENTNFSKNSIVAEDYAHEDIEQSYESYAEDQSMGSVYADLKLDEPKFPCPICNKVFRSRGSLASHKYAYHKDNHSNTSQLSLMQSQGLPPPMANMLPPNPLQMLDFQMDTSMEGMRDKNIVCPICQKCFSTKGSLATHKYNYHRTSASMSPMKPHDTSADDIIE